MSWRERQRVREQGKPPEPPERINLILDAKQVRELERHAAKACVTRDEYVGYVLGRHLARKGRRNSK